MESAMSVTVGLRERFLDRVDVSHTAGCWRWVGGQRRRGYGCIYIDGRHYSAHRVSHQLFVGPVLDGQCVLHVCDNPACVRPDHLRAGTQADNIADMMKKGRSPIGEQRSISKLTAEDVLSIRQLHANGVPQSDLARRYGVGQSNVSLICSRKTWRHV